MLGPLALIEASITAANTFSDPVQLRGKFNLSLSGTFVGTIHVQRSFDGGDTWLDVESHTAGVEKVGEEPEGALYRFGAKTANWTSGQADGRLSQ